MMYIYLSIYLSIYLYICRYIASIHACMIESYLTYLPSNLPSCIHRYMHTNARTHARAHTHTHKYVHARTRTHARTHAHTHTNEYRAELHGHRMLAVECEILELLLLLTFCNGKLGFIHVSDLPVTYWWQVTSGYEMANWVASKVACPKVGNPLTKLQNLWNWQRGLTASPFARTPGACDRTRLPCLCALAPSCPWVAVCVCVYACVCVCVCVCVYIRITQNIKYLVPHVLALALLPLLEPCDEKEKRNRAYTIPKQDICKCEKTSCLGENAVKASKQHTSHWQHTISLATAELSVLAEQSAVVYPQFRVCSVCILACVTGSDETDETTSNQGHSERIKPKVHALTHLENFLKPLSHDVLGFRVSII